MKNKQHIDILSSELIPLKGLSFIKMTPCASAFSIPSSYLIDQDFGILLELLETQTGF